MSYPGVFFPTGYQNSASFSTIFSNLTPTNGSNTLIFNTVDSVTHKFQPGWSIQSLIQAPELSQLALEVLSIPPCSTECERCFSEAACMLGKQRHATGWDTLGQLQCVKNWQRNQGVWSKIDAQRLVLWQCSFFSICIVLSRPGITHSGLVRQYLGIVESLQANPSLE